MSDTNDTVVDTGLFLSAFRLGETFASATSGNDILAGTTGNDSVDASDGNDSVFGAAGRDTLNGGNDDDRLHGGADNEILDGASGNDRLNGGLRQHPLSRRGFNENSLFQWQLRQRNRLYGDDREHEGRSSHHRYFAGLRRARFCEIIGRTD